MSKKHFYVQHGLTVGNLSVDANSGNIITTGELFASKITTSALKIDGELEFSDLNLTGNLSVGGDIDVQGVMSFSELDANKLTVDTEVLIGSISIDGISGNVTASVAILDDLYLSGNVTANTAILDDLYLSGNVTANTATLDDLYLSGSHMEIVGNTILVNGNPISGGGGGTIDSNISVVSIVESQILNAGTTSMTLANVVLTDSRPLVFVEGYSGQYYTDDFVVLDNTTIEFANPLEDAGKVSVIQHQLSYVDGNPISGGGGTTVSNISVVSTVESQILNAGATSITLANVVLTSTRPLVFVEGYSGQYYIDDFVVLDNTTIELVNPLEDAGKVSVIQHQLSYVDEDVISAFNAHEMQSDPHPQYVKRVDVGTCNVSVETVGVGGTTYSYPIDSSSANFDFYSCSMKEDGDAWVVQTATDVEIKWKVNSIEFTPATAGTYRFVYRDS